MSASPGQVARRKFDHDEARARYAAGESVRVLANEYGVTNTAVYLVVNASYRRRETARGIKRQLDTRMPCRGGCGVLVWQMRKNDPTFTGLCRTCFGERRRSHAHGTETEYTKHGCRCPLCTKAASDAKRNRRLKSRVPCSHGCGTLVDSINRRTPGKPPECLPCALRRIHSERVAA